jgi:hypothetical protein
MRQLRNGGRTILPSETTCAISGRVPPSRSVHVAREPADGTRRDVGVVVDDEE